MPPKVFAVILTLLWHGECLAQRGNKPGHIMPPPPAEWNDIPAPVILPENALDTFTIDDRFRIEMVAAEPLVEDPVCLAFDADGRMWVCEMRGFMPDIHGTGEDEPVGKIIILEDTDNDGAADKRTVFLDGIVLPRAIAHVEGGILYADHTTLYFVPNTNGNAGTSEIVDAEYAPEGALEHKPNGLLHGLDNWIYNAKSDKRYRRINARWHIEETEFRGQWGIAQDDYGRLLTNTNSNLVNLERLPPGVTIRNPDHEFQSKNGVHTDGNDVFPIRVTCGVNRGYMFGLLNEQGRLTRATAACGPVVYRGDNFPSEFYGDIFVPEPAGLLLKHIRVAENGYGFDLEFAYPNREFLASTDERSRIVNAYTAPDGTLYLVDFYRGILQHYKYISTYLHEQILHRGLEKPVGLGRIYRVVSKNKKPGPQPNLSGVDPIDLVRFLAHPNGWWRDTAQRLIVQSGDLAAIPGLQALAEDASKPLGQIHALWTLEGLPGSALTHGTLARVAKGTDDPRVLAQVIRLAGTADSLPGRSLARRTGPSALAVLQSIAAKTGHPLVDLHLALYTGRLQKPEAIALLNQTVSRHPGDKLFLDAALSSLAGREKEFLAVNEAAAAYVANIENRRKPRVSMIVSKADKAQYALGEIEYEKICLACHQANGEGQPYLAPPLVNSEWVHGDAARIISIVLDGMTGPVHVAGEKYDVPEIQPLMPGLRFNPELTDEKLAAIITYVRNSWGNAAAPVSPDAISKIRAATADRTAPYTERELKKRN